MVESDGIVFETMSHKSLFRRRVRRATVPFPNIYFTLPGRNLGFIRMILCKFRKDLGSCLVVIS